MGHQEPERIGFNISQVKALTSRVLKDFLDLIFHKFLDAKYNFKTSRWTSSGHDIDPERWWNSTTPENESRRNFPIMNDRLLWRLVLLDSTNQWYYGEQYITEKNDYRPRIFSTTDLYKKGFHIEYELHFTNQPIKEQDDGSNLKLNLRGPVMMNCSNREFVVSRVISFVIVAKPIIV